MRHLSRLVLAVLCVGLCVTSASATTITKPKTWATNDTLTAADLNNGLDTIYNDYNGSISPANFATTLTFTSTQYLDLSAIVSSTTKGLRLPTGTTAGTNNGQLAWDGTAKALKVGDGTAANFDALTAAQGTVGQLLRSGGANALDTWTTPTYPNAAGTAGVIIRSDGTNFGTSTPTFPNTGGTAGQWLRTDGTNYGLSTPTLPNTGGTAGQWVRGDGTNLVFSTATIPTTAGAAGTYLCSDGTNWVTCSAPAFSTVTLSTGNVTTTSTSPVDFTGATVTMTTGAFPTQINWSATGQNSSTTGNLYFRVLVDAASIMGTFGNENDTPTAAKNVNVSLSVQSAALTAASHTEKMQWAVDAGTGTTFCNNQSNCIFSVHEIR